MKMTFDLDQQIAQLQQRFGELKSYSGDPSPTAPSLVVQQAKMAAWLASINQQLIFLRNKRANRVASQVVVNPPTVQEENDLTGALRTLSAPIRQNEAFSNLLSVVTELLNAAGTIGNKA
jgi:CHASE3 domain sensor protein